MMKHDEAMAKHMATPTPAKPMCRKSRNVPRGPSRTSMKHRRNSAANTDRQKTTVQLSDTSRNRANAPPVLQAIAEPATSKQPLAVSAELLTGSGPPTGGIGIAVALMRGECLSVARGQATRATSYYRFCAIATFIENQTRSDPSPSRRGRAAASPAVRRARGTPACSRSTLATVV